MTPGDYKYKGYNFDCFDYNLEVKKRYDDMLYQEPEDLTFTYSETCNCSKAEEAWNDLTVEEKFMVICATQTRDEAACLCGLLNSDEEKEILGILTKNNLNMLRSVLEEYLT